MIQIHQLKVPVSEISDAVENKNEEDSYQIELDILKNYSSKVIKVKKENISQFSIERRSLDARKKPVLYYVYTVIFSLSQEDKILRKNKNINISPYVQNVYQISVSGFQKLKTVPVIVGMGPAGIFCAYMLSKLGYKPIIIERGKKVEDRKQDVKEFWNNGKLLTNSNVQFGEGGAGTFSDGKLNTLIRDKSGRNKEVLKAFVECGAPKHILYDHKPHIGTDILLTVVHNMREKILSQGGEIRYETILTDLIIENQKLKSIELNQNELIDCELLVLAIGHSARDTFYMLNKRHLPMAAKDFAVGFRVQHKQQQIDQNQYGDCNIKMPASAYKLSTQTSNNHSVYSFCMCPGGYVVNASSEKERLVVNGMSYSGRGSGVANSAIIVSVNKEDFCDETKADSIQNPLLAVEFQRKIEEKAFQLANGKIPLQYFDDFCENTATTNLRKESFLPAVKGEYAFANLRNILSEKLNNSFIEAMHKFAHNIEGFDQPNVILAGIESRTSSPVRIYRNTEYESDISGIYPCGEGAGYAGGITSAAMDGLAVAEAIAKKYIP